MRSIGNSDLRVSPVGLGCWQFSRGKGIGGSYWPPLPDKVTAEIVRRSLEGGVNWFDTAEAYGWGASEEILAQTLAMLGKTPGDVLIATKWWPAPRTARSITRTIGRRKETLNGFPIALYQVHQPVSFSSVEREMDAMADLAARGEIRFVGVSNFNRNRMCRAAARLRAHGLSLVSNQMRYNLMDRRIEFNGVLEAARELGISIIAYSPLAQGVLTGRFHRTDRVEKKSIGVRRFLKDFHAASLEKSRPLVRLLEEIGAKHGSTCAQVALAWLLAFQGEMIVVIPGATRPDQAQENAGAMNLTLAGDEIAEIDRESRKLCAAL